MLEPVSDRSVRTKRPLLLSVGVILSSILLTGGLIGYQSALLFPETGVTQKEWEAALDRKPNHAEAVDSEPIPESALAQRAEQLSRLRESNQDLHSGSAIIVDGIIYSALEVRDDEGNVKIVLEDLDAMRHEPGPASDDLIRHDAMRHLMSSSKSIVIMPRTPEDVEKAIEKYRLAAVQQFSSRDRNGDRKLSKSELHPVSWKYFLNQGAVKNGHVDFDAFLKNYLDFHRHSGFK